MNIYNRKYKKVNHLYLFLIIKDFDKGQTPLHVAASRGAKQAMELLVMRGCDVNVQVYKYLIISYHL